MPNLKHGTNTTTYVLTRAFQLLRNILCQQDVILPFPQILQQL